MNYNNSQSNGKWKARFFTIWGGQQISLVGSRIASFALVWWITATTGSATVLATATLVAMLPEVLLAPFAGALIDRLNRRKVMLIADSFIALVSACLAFLFWSERMQVWHVYLVMLAQAIGGTFHWPAMHASTSLMVPAEHLSRVAGANSTAQGIRSIAVPPLGALLLTILPLHWIMLLDVITAAFAIGPLLFLDIPQPAGRMAADAAKTPFWQGVREGLRYVTSWPGLFAVLIMATVINFVLNPAGSLMPILVTKHFGGEALQLGWLNSAWGGGVIVGGLVLSAWGGFHRRVFTSLMGLIGLGLGFAIIGLAPPSAFALAFGGMLLIGFMNPITNGPLLAVLQARVDANMQGRVFTAVQGMATAMSPLSMAIAGPVADAFGVQVWYLFGGAVCALLGVASFFVPAIVHLEDHAPPAPVRGEEAAAMPEAALDIPAD